MYGKSTLITKSIQVEFFRYSIDIINTLTGRGKAIITCGKPCQQAFEI